MKWTHEQIEVLRKIMLGCFRDDRNGFIALHPPADQPGGTLRLNIEAERFLECVLASPTLNVGAARPWPGGFQAILDRLEGFERRWQERLTTPNEVRGNVTVRDNSRASSGTGHFGILTEIELHARIVELERELHHTREAGAHWMLKYRDLKRRMRGALRGWDFMRPGV